MRMFIKQLYAVKIKEEEFQYILDKLLYFFLSRKLLENLGAGINSATDIQKAHEDIEKSVLSVTKAMKSDHFRKLEMHECLPERLAYYDNKINLPKGIASGIDQLDALTGGWRPGELVVLLASPGSGKSTLLLNFAENANKRSRVNVGFASLEMPYEDEMERYHALITGIDYSKIRNRLLTTDERTTFLKRMCLRAIERTEWPAFKEWFAQQDLTGIVDYNAMVEIMKGQFQMRKEKFFFFDIPRNCTPKILEMEIKAVLAQQDCPIFVIDHLNVMQPSIRTKDHWMDLGLMANQLKGIARDYRITILTAAQLGDVKTGEKITTDNVKYARKIAEEADYVIGFKVTEEDKLLNRIRLEMTKHRHTQEGIISVKQMFSQMKIGNYKEVEGD